MTIKGKGSIYLKTKFRHITKLLWRLKYVWLAVVLAGGIFFWYCLPSTLFDDPVSIVLEDREGNLLSAVIAKDGQWRFPERKAVPGKFATALITFEDKRFYSHPGVDPLAMGRAVYQNISRGGIHSGGSTLSMQVIRLSRKGKSRTVFEKVVEMVLAARMELTYSKTGILAMYASHAPFGGNVVGLDAASWRYFAKPAEQLSWAEAACLAVLPNSPSMINPGRNREALQKKRDKLLKKLHREGSIGKTEYELSLREPLPLSPHRLPQAAPHLMAHIQGLKGVKTTSKVATSIDPYLQETVQAIINRHQQHLSGNGIHNAAALVADVNSGKILAYVGNTTNDIGPAHGGAVDIITAPRSSGSILKPFLFAQMLEKGQILPESLLPDVPVQIHDFQPQNYDRTFHGGVSASRALAESLNVPAVYLLMKCGIIDFHHLLKKAGLTTLAYPASHYGLSLILGGAEVNLLDLASAYSGLARTVNYYTANSSQYPEDAFRPLSYSDSVFSSATAHTDQPVLSAGAAWHTLEAMLEVKRPEDEAAWREFASSKKIAWKTGTSYGHRDAWSVGVTPRYVVAVWAGNADGEGRPGLVGAYTAAPIMFDIFSHLNTGGWFPRPYDDLVQMNICRESGYKAGKWCALADSQFIGSSGRNSEICPYHKVIYTNTASTYRLNHSCNGVEEMIAQPWFVLPPTMETYYRQRHPAYKKMPPLHADCRQDAADPVMELVYPRLSSDLYIPVEIDGSKGAVVFEAVHRDDGAVIYWHIDNEFVGSTRNLHQMTLQPSPGPHQLTLVDHTGSELKKGFRIESR